MHLDEALALVREAFFRLIAYPLTQIQSYTPYG